jgi:DNA-binding XRE family transcriptional regulator
MDHIDEVISEMKARVPGVKTRVERAESPRGPVWIDVTNGRAGVAVEWRQGMGFGVTSLPTAGQGEAADEVYPSTIELVDRVEELLGGKARTEPPHEAVLRQLRERRRISQEDLARRLGVSQPNVCRLERRVDMNIRTLRSVVEALGGHLEIVARFDDDETVRISQFDSSESEEDSARAR